MKSRHTLFSAALALSLGPLPPTVNAQPAQTALRPPASATTAAVTSKATTNAANAANGITLPGASASLGSSTDPLLSRPSGDWIRYDDASYTPVVDDVSRALADARAALKDKDNARASQAMARASRALDAQAGRAARLDRQRAAADMKQAQETEAKMVALTTKLDLMGLQIKEGKLPTTAEFDQVLNKATRADLDRRWLVSDVTTWYPVALEPQRHFTAADADFANKNTSKAASEVRKAASFVRLEAARATGDAKIGLEQADAALDKTAVALDKGTVKSAASMDHAFARADHALALSHRANAAEAWAHKAYDQAGYELKAAAHSLEAATTWSAGEAKSAALAGAADARTVGDKLASGGVWTRDEVSKGFGALGDALNRLGKSLGLKSRASPFDTGA